MENTIEIKELGKTYNLAPIKEIDEIDYFEREIKYFESKLEKEDWPRLVSLFVHINSMKQ